MSLMAINRSKFLHLHAYIRVPRLSLDVVSVLAASSIAHLLQPTLSPSIDMGSSRARSSKNRHLTSLFLMRVVVLSACVAGALSYARSRGPPDRSNLRVKWNVTGEARARARWGAFVCSGVLNMCW